jgi:hypothetical protein
MRQEENSNDSSLGFVNFQNSIEALEIPNVLRSEIPGNQVCPAPNIFGNFQYIGRMGGEAFTPESWIDTTTFSENYPFHYPSCTDINALPTAIQTSTETFAPHFDFLLPQSEHFGDHFNQVAFGGPTEILPGFDESDFKYAVDPTNCAETGCSTDLPYQATREIQTLNATDNVIRDGPFPISNPVDQIQLVGDDSPLRTYTAEDDYGTDTDNSTSVDLECDSSSQIEPDQKPTANQQMTRLGKELDQCDTCFGVVGLANPRHTV